MDHFAEKYTSEFTRRGNMASYYDAQQVRPSSSCGSGFTCGEQYHILENQVNEIVGRVEELEENKKYISEYYATAKKVINLHRCSIIILAILQFVAVGIVAYFYSSKSGILITGASLIGLSVFTNGFILPESIKSLEKRIVAIEKKLKISDE